MVNISRIDIPATRDPFVNAQVVPAGKDPITGEDRFWATTWNSNSGCIGALFTASGKNKIFRFDKNKAQYGFYGASYQGNDIMWLSGFLDNITKLNLQTGETFSFNTGLTHDLSLSGFVYDESTGKAFSCAYCQGDKKRKAFVFDTKAYKTIKTFDDIPLKNNQLCYSIKNNDGTYTFINMIPDMELMIWNPKDDSLEVVTESLSAHPHGNYFKAVKSPDGNIYIPDHGWFSPEQRQFIDRPKAVTEACWFGMKENIIYGAKWAESTCCCTILEWNIKNETVMEIGTVPDTMTYHFALTSDQKIVALNMYGYFYRIDLVSGALETSVKFETDSIGHIDCFYRLDDNRILATPFITQRFFEIDIIKNKGYDLGRATGGVGEVLAVIPFNKKIYMASYTKGFLTEYDPCMPACFPENPRPVVEPPAQVMRPVGYCTDDKSIYYSCSHEYGYLGSMTIKYTPAEGKTLFSDYPLKHHMIRSMFFDRLTGGIIAGTTYEADCKSCPSMDDNSFIVMLDAETLHVTKKIYPPIKSVMTHIYGVLHDGRYLIGLHAITGIAYIAMNSVSFDFDLYDIGIKPKGFIQYAQKPGYFIVADDGRIGVWNSMTKCIEKIICNAKGFYKMHVQDNNIYLIYNDHIELIEDCIFNFTA